MVFLSTHWDIFQLSRGFLGFEFSTSIKFWCDSFLWQVLQAEHDNFRDIDFYTPLVHLKLPHCSSQVYSVQKLKNQYLRTKIWGAKWERFLRSPLVQIWFGRRKIPLLFNGSSNTEMHPEFFRGKIRGTVCFKKHGTHAEKSGGNTQGLSKGLKWEEIERFGIKYSRVNGKRTLTALMSQQLQ